MLLLTWHITAAAGWFALIAVQVITPWRDLKIYLIETAAITVGTGVWMALGSQLGLFRFWWLVVKQVGVLGLLTVGGLTLAGHPVPYARWAALAVLWALVWMSVAKPGGRTGYGQRVSRRGQHTR